MGDVAAGFGGFILGMFACTSISRWLMSLYMQFGGQPPEARRLQMLVPLLLLHSGPWVIALLAFGALKLFTGEPYYWRPWLTGGFIIGVAFMIVTVTLAWKKVITRKVAANER